MFSEYDLFSHREKRKGKLGDDSRAPHNVWNKTPSEIEDKVADCRRKTGYGKRRESYDLEKIAPFEELQMDVKEILDKKGLLKEIYQHFQRVKLPLYQWTCIDVKTN